MIEKIAPPYDHEADRKRSIDEMIPDILARHEGALRKLAEVHDE